MDGYEDSKAETPSVEIINDKRWWEALLSIPE